MRTEASCPLIFPDTPSRLCAYLSSPFLPLCHFLCFKGRGLGGRHYLSHPRLQCSLWKCFFCLSWPFFPHKLTLRSFKIHRKTDNFRFQVPYLTVKCKLTLCSLFFVVEHLNTVAASCCVKKTNCRVTPVVSPGATTYFVEWSLPLEGLDSISDPAV